MDYKSNSKYIQGFGNPEETISFSSSDTLAEMQQKINRYSGQIITGTLNLIFSPGAYDSGKLIFPAATIGNGKIIVKNSETSKALYGSISGHSVFNGSFQQASLSLSGNILTVSGLGDMSVYENNRIAIFSLISSSYGLKDVLITSASSTTLTLSDVSGLDPAEIAKKGTAILIYSNAIIPEMAFENCNVEFEAVEAALDLNRCNVKFSSVSSSKVNIKSCTLSGSGLGIHGNTESSFVNVKADDLDNIGALNANIRLSKETRINDVVGFFLFGGKLFIDGSSELVAGLMAVFSEVVANSYAVLVDNLSLFRIETLSQINNLLSLNGHGIRCSTDSFVWADCDFDKFDIGLYSEECGKTKEDNCSFTNCNTPFSPSPKNTRGNNQGVTI